MAIIVPVCGSLAFQVKVALTPLDAWPVPDPVVSHPAVSNTAQSKLVPIFLFIMAWLLGFGASPTAQDC
jgi:hypothetical protein